MQPPKVGFYILARDKAQHVRKSVESALAQTYSPLTIYLSDQGSTDGTAEILDEIAQTYSGPHHIVRLHCPDRTPKSMTALLRHLNWAMDTTESDLILIQSADDFSHPQRTEAVVGTWLEHKPSYVGTLVRFIDSGDEPNAENDTYTLFQREGFATGAEILDQRIGGSTSCAYDREFWNKIRPVTELMLADVAMPFMAAQDRGYYLIANDLHTYVRHAGSDVTGLEGQMNGLSDDTEKLQMNELMSAEVTTGLVGLFEPYVNGKLMFKSEEDYKALERHIVQGTINWAMIRRHLHANNVRPIGRPA